MCRNRRDRRKPRGQVFFITARARKGLPFVPRLLVEKLLLGILASAQSQYPVKLCAYVFMGNHYHLVLTGQSCHISPFMNYIQGNIAKSIQRLIPNYYNGWFWEDRFKEQVLLTAEDVIAKMEYIYLNPVRARLTAKVAEYPGLCSYNNLISGKEHLLAKWIPMGCLRELPQRYKSSEDIKITKDCLSLSEDYHELKIEPFAWFAAFSDELIEEQVKARILGYISQEEEDKTPVIGAKRLKQQFPRKQHKPKDKKPTPYLICHDKELRISAIASYQNFCELCRDAWWLIKKGIKACWPKGAFLPSFQRGWALTG